MSVRRKPHSSESPMRHAKRIACLVALLAAGPVTAEEKIEGRWTVVSAEAAGGAVPGLKDAELVLADGKKVFTLPNKQVEKGTYRIDATRKPGEIDSTTDGRDGTEK